MGDEHRLQRGVASAGREPILVVPTFHRKEDATRDAEADWILTSWHVHGLLGTYMLCLHT